MNEYQRKRAQRIINGQAGIGIPGNPQAFRNPNNAEVTKLADDINDFDRAFRADAPVRMLAQNIKIICRRCAHMGQKVPKTLKGCYCPKCKRPDTVFRVTDTMRPWQLSTAWARMAFECDHCYMLYGSMYLFRCLCSPTAPSRKHTGVACRWCCAQQKPPVSLAAELSNGRGVDEGAAQQRPVVSDIPPGRGLRIIQNPMQVDTIDIHPTATATATLTEADFQHYQQVYGRIVRAWAEEAPTFAERNPNPAPIPVPHYDEGIDDIDDDFDEDDQD